MNKKLKQIGWAGLWIGMLCFASCLDPIDNSFDQSKSNGKTLVINEIVAGPTNGDNDWVELYNLGQEAVCLRDFAMLDNNTEREPVILPDKTLEPGEFIVIQATDEAPEDGSYFIPFKLGADDRITLYWGLTIVDELDWANNEIPPGNSYGRFPDGLGDTCALVPTPGTTNEEIIKILLVINEIVSSPTDTGSDWIEFYNVGEQAVYLGDYSIVDDNEAHEPVILPPILLETGQYIVIQATDNEPADGSWYVPIRLGSDDGLTLYHGPDIIDVLDWGVDDAPIGYSFGRLPDGTKELQTLMPTPGQANQGVE